MVICEKVSVCKYIKTKHIINCRHSKPHEEEFSCVSGYCDTEKVKCNCHSLKEIRKEKLEKLNEISI
jgi:hypothetical protein